MDWLRRLFLRRGVPVPASYGIAYLDMRGRLRFDVQTAIRRGWFADEIAASRMLGKALNNKEK